MHLETKDLILRRMQPSDLEGLFELDSDPIVHKYLGNQPRTHIEESQKDLEDNMRQWDERGVARWTSIEKSSGDFIGWSGLRLNNDLTYNNHTNFYDVGYRFIPRYWGKGYATESSIVALDYFFNVMKKELLCGIAETENIASNRVLQKVGLHFIEDFTIDDIPAKWYELKREDYGKKMS
ncbi:GNAT family N-acetyltransferase [Winogradskyella maritima]|uniref:GNAT family N-acetyltransferase n=1 Tax=Winogradskyella maritima TaxID=1517766 RepID=A0ABV8AEM4_9FLAO|nr:GNAT family N-acetyltransferase [Winogradskyella maritima]